MSNKYDKNNGFPITDEQMDFLIKESVRLELERQRIIGIEPVTVDESMLVNTYTREIKEKKDGDE